LQSPIIEDSQFLTFQVVGFIHLCNFSATPVSSFRNLHFADATTTSTASLSPLALQPEFAPALKPPHQQ
jgi:hypothetical protein